MAERTGKELIEATRPFAEESAARSWAHLGATLAAWALTFAVAASPVPWPLRLLAATLGGLVVVRVFILYHDHLHGALLRNAPAARAFFWLFGVWVMAPPKVWRETHNYHHAHTAQLVGSHIGSYPTQTVSWWRQASPWERWQYAFTRHPLTVLFGWFTAFFLEMCVLSFVRAPRKRWDSALSGVATVALAAFVIARFGFAVWFWAVYLPHFIASALGAYLFYAQHNYPGMDIQPRETWEYTRAALESSSYMELGPVLSWFTGNIGYHHVHHLNPGIPFYRLPEAMAAVPELQHPGKVTLAPSSVAECFKLKLWDPERRRMVGFP